VNQHLSKDVANPIGSAKEWREWSGDFYLLLWLLGVQKPGGLVLVLGRGPNCMLDQLNSKLQLTTEGLGNMDAWIPSRRLMFPYIRGTGKSYGIPRETNAGEYIVQVNMCDHQGNQIGHLIVLALPHNSAGHKAANDLESTVAARAKGIIRWLDGTTFRTIEINPTSYAGRVPAGADACKSLDELLELQGRVFQAA